MLPHIHLEILNKDFTLVLFSLEDSLIIMCSNLFSQLSDVITWTAVSPSANMFEI